MSELKVNIIAFILTVLLLLVLVGSGYGAYLFVTGVIL